MPSGKSVDGVCVLVMLTLQLSVAVGGVHGAMALQLLLMLSGQFTSMGVIVSWMETILPQVDTAELISVTVSSTVVSPRSAQLKAAWSIAMLCKPQSLVLPLSTSVVEIVAFPVPSNGTVMSWQMAAGGLQAVQFPLLSSTVTVAIQLALSSFTSCTVNVTG